MRHRATALLGSIVLSSCAAHIAPGDTVRDRAAAIAIGRNECVNESTGIGSQSIPLLQRWHASLAGDYWQVWSGGPTYDDSFLNVLIAKRDGKTTGCVLSIH